MDGPPIDFEDMVEDAPCGYVSLSPGGRVEYVESDFPRLDRPFRRPDTREALQ